MKRVLKTPARIKGIYIGSAGSDVTTAGSRIVISLRATDGTVRTIIELRETAINRDFSGSSTQRNVVQSQTVTFPPIEAKEIRVNMNGNGWFNFERTMLFAEGCTA